MARAASPALRRRTLKKVRRDGRCHSQQIIFHSRRPAPVAAQRHPLRVLLAEDNTVNQQIALLVLESMGYRADVVSNDSEAVEAVDTVPYDVVFECSGNRLAMEAGPSQLKRGGTLVLVGAGI